MERQKFITCLHFHNATYFRKSKLTEKLSAFSSTLLSTFYAHLVCGWLEIQDFLFLVFR
jgi:hypothetical protein